MFDIFLKLFINQPLAVKHIYIYPVAVCFLMFLKLLQTTNQSLKTLAIQPTNRHSVRLAGDALEGPVLRTRVSVLMLQGTGPRISTMDVGLPLQLVA